MNFGSFDFCRMSAQCKASVTYFELFESDPVYREPSSVSMVTRMA